MMYLEYKTFGPYLSFMNYTCFRFVVTKIDFIFYEG